MCHCDPAKLKVAGNKKGARVGDRVKSMSPHCWRVVAGLKNRRKDLITALAPFVKSKIALLVGSIPCFVCSGQRQFGPFLVLLIINQSKSGAGS